MEKQKCKIVQEWIPFNNILDNGIIQLKDNSYIKIIKVKPINFNLKSELEKEAILNSYKLFLKTCNFDFQILIQSNKEDLSKHINTVNKNCINEEKNIQDISKEYIKFIKNLNHDKKSSSKNFYIILKYKNENKNAEDIKDYFIEELNDKYFKIKDCLSRCGNIITDFNDKQEIISILFSFLNTRIYFNQV